MAKLPRPSGKDMARFLEREGFQLVQIRGSHHYFARGGEHTSVPVHGNRSLKTGTLRNILRSIDLTPEDFAERFNKYSSSSLSPRSWLLSGRHDKRRRAIVLAFATLAGSERAIAAIGIDSARPAR